ncbi:MAG: putative lipid II flippase FtsW [Candidatus Berkelbacteria bacterium]
MKRFIQKKKPNLIFALTIFLLIFFGIVMISSSSVVISLEHTGKNYSYVVKQIESLIFGLIAMFATYNIDYRFWKKNSFWLLIITLSLLLLVFIPGIGKSAGGAHRWIGLGSHWFQPSELIKLTFIIYLAAWLDNMGEKVNNFFTGFLPFAFLVGLVGFLIMLQPDLGTFSVILLSAVTVFFVAGADLSHLMIGSGGMLALLAIMIKISPYRQQRLQVFLNPSIDAQGSAYHINQALLAVGAGGLWGLGFGQSRQKYLYLPEAHTDSIFAIIAEELGFIRSSLVVLAYLFVAYLGFKIAQNAPDKFSRLVCVGITSWILCQAFINIGAIIGVLPFTGVPLPFISYGGSSLIILLAGVGLMLNISRINTGETI